MIGRVEPELHVSIVERPCGGASRSALFVHGILGSSRNWLGFAKRFVRVFPAWRAILIDLPSHGRSCGTSYPATVAGCAAAIESSTRRLGLSIDAICGHSFGGKVAITYVTAVTAQVGNVWVLDANPGPGGDRAEEVVRVLDAVSRIGPVIGTRREIVDSMREARLPAALARWMSANVERHPDGGFRWHFDPEGVRRLLEDYARLDLWETLGRCARERRVDLVRGERSDRYATSDVQRLEELSREKGLRLQILANAGHWLQVDNPRGLLALMADPFACPPHVGFRADSAASSLNSPG